MILLLLLKVTLVCGMALGALSWLRASAALRHLLCASALAGVLAMPVTLLIPPERVAFRIDASSLATSQRIPVSTQASLPQMLALVWGLGSVAILVWIAGGYWMTYRFRRSSARLVAASPVPVYYADVPVPFVCGLVRPAIYLPHFAEGWTKSQFDAAVQHELQHVHRYDLWIMLLARVACALYWFHPVVWLVARRLREEQESACDDAVLSCGFEAAGYAEVLLLASKNLSPTQLIGCSMLTNKSLKQRIARVLDKSLTRASSTKGLRAAAGVSAAVIAVVGLLAGTPRAHAWQEPPYKVGNGVTSPRVLRKVEPSYTPEAKDAKVQGTVVLSVVVTADGRAQDVRVVRGLGSGLDEKAVDVVANDWLFVPGTKDGQAVDVRATIEINFKLL